MRALWVDAAESSLTCARDGCEETFPVTRKRGLLPKRFCSAKCQYADWRKRNPERVREYEHRADARRRANGWSKHHYERYGRDWARRKKYGITTAEYEELLAAQGGVCAICQNECSFGRQLAVDHDHESGVVRGLLRAAIRYLEGGDRACPLD